MAYLLQFGNYTFPNTLMPAHVGGSQHRGSSARPRASGAITQIARREEATVEIVGQLTADTPDALRTALDQLAAAVYNGKQPLFFGRDDQYYRDAQVQDMPVDWNSGLTYGLVSDIRLTFVAADYPERFAVATSSPALSPTGGTIAVGGNALALPTWTITIGGGGTGTLTLGNATTGETALITPLSGSWNAGDVITLNRDTYQVTLNGVPTFGLLDLRIPALDASLAATNTIALACSGSATVGSLAVSYQSRFK